MSVEAIERARGQRAVTAADFARLPEIFNAPETVTDVGASKTGRRLVRYEKTIAGKRYVVTLELRAARKALGLLTRDQVREIAATKDGLAVDGFDFTLHPSAIRKVSKDHGDIEIERRRGNRAITAEDYSRLPEVINSAETFEDAGRSWRTGQPLVRIRHRVGNEDWILIFEVLRRRRMLALDTFFIARRRS